MANSRRVPNINGAANSYLKVVSKKDNAASQFSSAVKSAPKAHQQLVQNVLNAVKASISDSDTYQLNLDSRTADVVLGRIASLLDEAKSKFVETELAEVKQEILDEISGLSVESILKNFLLSQIAELFDDDAKKEDIEDLKAFIAEKLSASAEEAKAENASKLEKEAGKEGQTFRDKEVDSLKDESVGEYKDSTIAENFTTLQNAIQQQIDILNANIAAIPGGIGLGRIAKFVGTGAARTLNAIGKLSSKVGSFAKKSLVGIGKVGAILAGGAFKGIVKTLGFIKSGIGKVGNLVGKVAGSVVGGLTTIGAGIKGIGSKVGGAILHPFKAIGGFFSRKKKDKIAEIKEKLREKFMNFIMGMVEKIWNFVEPILSKLKIFMLIALVPILTTAMTVLTIVASLSLLIVGAYLVYKWIKSGKLWAKLKSLGKSLLDGAIKFIKILPKMILGSIKLLFWTIPKMLFDFGYWIGENLPEWLLKAWEWLKDISSWLWDKLKEFGNWLWNESALGIWIHDKIITPWQKTMQEIDSAGGLWPWFKEKLSQWWDQVCQIAKTIGDAVVKWWQETDIYKSYQEIKAKGFGAWFKEKIQQFVDNMLAIGKKVKEWWDSTAVGKWLAGLAEKIEKLKQKLSTVFVHIPGWGGGKNIYPFAPAVGKPFIVDAKDDQDAIDKKEKDRILEIQQKLQNNDIGWFETRKGLEKELSQLQTKQAARNKPSLAQQQVQNALGPVNSLNNINAGMNVELQKTGEEMSNKAAAAEQATEDYREQQTMLGSQYLAEMQDMRKEMREGFKDPSVVPVYVPSQSRSAALPMRRF